MYYMTTPLVRTSTGQHYYATEINGPIAAKDKFCSAYDYDHYYDKVETVHKHKVIHYANGGGNKYHHYAVDENGYRETQGGSDGFGNGPTSVFPRHTAVARREAYRNVKIKIEEDSDSDNEERQGAKRKREEEAQHHENAEDGERSKKSAGNDADASQDGSGLLTSSESAIDSTFSSVVSESPTF